MQDNESLNKEHFKLIDNKKILWIINPNSGDKKTSRLIHEIGLIEPPVAYVVTKNLKELEKTFTNQIEEFKAMEGVAGVHLMAIEWEHRVPELAERAKVLPRPQM